MPSHKGDIEKGFFGHPAKLDREVRGQRKNVVKSAVIRDEDLRTIGIDVFQPFDLDAGTAQPKVVFRPSAHAEMLEPAAAGHKAARMETVAQKAVLSADTVQHQIVNSFALNSSIPRIYHEFHYGAKHRISKWSREFAQYVHRAGFSRCRRIGLSMRDFREPLREAAAFSASIPEKVDRDAGEHDDQSRPGEPGLHPQQVQHHERSQENVNCRQHRVAERFVRPIQIRPLFPQHKKAAHRQDIKKERGEDHVIQQFAVSAAEHQDRRPDRLNDERENRGLLARGNPRDLLKKQSVRCHRIIDARDPARIMPFAHPKVATRMARLMKVRPQGPIRLCAARVPTRSSGAEAMAARGKTFRYTIFVQI